MQFAAYHVSEHPPFVFYPWLMVLCLNIAEVSSNVLDTAHGAIYKTHYSLLLTVNCIVLRVEV